jgi:hypothetical protein
VTYAHLLNRTIACPIYDNGQEKAVCGGEVPNIDTYLLMEDTVVFVWPIKAIPCNFSMGRNICMLFMWFTGANVFVYTERNNSFKSNHAPRMLEQRIVSLAQET